MKLLCSASPGGKAWQMNTPAAAAVLIHDISGQKSGQSSAPQLQNCKCCYHAFTRQMEHDAASSSAIFLMSSGPHYAPGIPGTRRHEDQSRSYWSYCIRKANMRLPQVWRDFHSGGIRSRGLSGQEVCFDGSGLLAAPLTLVKLTARGPNLAHGAVVFCLTVQK